MPKPPLYEDSALGKLFISGYDEGSLAWPILEIHIDAKNPVMSLLPGQGLKAFPTALGNACDVSDKYPNHVLTSLKTYKADQRQVLQYRILPGPWTYDIATDKETLSLVFIKKRQNIAANIREFSIVKNGTGVTITPAITGGAVTGAAVSGGTGYADFFPVIFTDPGGSGVTAQGYGIAANGVPQSIFITIPGSGYGSAPTATALGGATVEARQDIDSYLAWEIIEIFTIASGYSETESVPVRYPMILTPGSEYASLSGVGVIFNGRPPITRTTFAQVLVIFGAQIDGTVNKPPASPVLANGKTVLNPQVLWNQVTSYFQSFFSSGLTDIITDAFSFTESRTVNSIIYTNTVSVPASIPTATQYVASIVAGNYVLYRCDSKRWRGNIYVTKLVYIPCL